MGPMGGGKFPKADPALFSSCRKLDNPLIYFRRGTAQRAEKHPPQNSCFEGGPLQKEQHKGLEANRVEGSGSIG